METVKPIFIKDQDLALFQQLRNQVKEKLRHASPKKQLAITIKALLFPILYFAAYAAALIWSASKWTYYFFFALMGFLLVINFLNLIHEAVHNTLFANKRINRWYVHFFDLMGANSFIWKIRHTRLHHNYPNVMGWDSDIEQSPMARVYPHASFSKIHRYQHVYLPLLYPLYLFNWLLVRDFKDFFNKKQILWKAIDHIPIMEYVKLFLFKAVFLFYTIIIPVLFFSVLWMQALSGFVIMVLTASLISLLVLLSPHANIESDFPMPDEKGKMPTGWFRHQLSCTNDVTEDNWFIRFFMGCFNYHIAHHLFPSVHHVHYPEVTEVVKQFAEENNLPYRSFPIRVSLRNHYRLLKQNAVHENLFEETM